MYGNEVEERRSLAKPEGGGGAGGPHNAFSEFCRYIYTFGNLSVHVSRQDFICTDKVSEVPTRY